MTLDDSYMAQTFGTNKALLTKTMALFVQTAPEIFEKITNAVNDSNSADLALNAHSLKGSVGYFTQDGIYKTSFELEQLGKAGINSENEGQIKTLLTKLSEELNETILALNYYIQTNQ